MRHGVRCEQDGETALMHASRSGHTEEVVQLLDKGADVNAQNKVCGGESGALTGSREGSLRGRHRGQRGWEMAVTRTRQGMWRGVWCNISDVKFYTQPIEIQSETIADNDPV